MDISLFWELFAVQIS